MGRLWLSEGRRVVGPPRTSGVDVSKLDKSTIVLLAAKDRISLDVVIPL